MQPNADFESHFSQFADHEVNHLVTATEMMVKRNGHAIFQSALFDSLLQAHQFGAMLLCNCSSFRYFAMIIGSIVHGTI